MQGESSSSGRASGCLVRLFWMGIGNFVLAMSAIGIGQSQAGWGLTYMDALFWGTALCLLAVRYADIRYLAGETSDSRPATMSDWRRYAATVLGVSLVLWIGAHLLA